jgi:uncharacterized glyoxalase superfamily protein PhnB
MTVTPIPDGYHSVTPWIIGKNTAGVIDFLTAAFDGADLGRMADEEGNIGHAEVRIGDSVVMLFDKPDWPPTPAFLRLYVEDIHTTLKKAVAAGATVVTEPTHLFWGDLVARFSDPFGNLYWVQTRIEVVDEDEMMRRMTDPGFTKALDYVQSALFMPETR